MSSVIEIQNHLIDAAEEVIRVNGVARFTLETVARQAGMSKSGLLHHFPSKELLIDAIVERTVDRWQESLNESIAAQKAGPCPTARGLLNCCLGTLSDWNEQLRRSSAALLTVLVQGAGNQGGGNRTRLHDFYAEIHKKLKTESKGNPASELVLAVVDGLWLRWVTGLSPMADSEIVQIRDLLEALLNNVEQDPIKNLTGKGESF